MKENEIGVTVLDRREALLAIAGAAACMTGCRPARSSAPRDPRIASAPPRVDARWERVVRAFDESLEASFAPGGAVGIVLDGKPAFTAGRGVKKLGTAAPVTTSTLFRLESVTKTFTALSALSLVEKNVLSLDAPIESVVPWVSFSDPDAGKNVTLRRLLTHTAGLSRNAIRKLGDVRRGFEYEDLFRKSPLSLGPLDHFEYSNTGYLLVGAAVVRASKTSFDDALRTLVTKPVGMNTATADGSVATRLDHADGYGFDENQQERSFDPVSLDPYVQRPVGGLHASIDDLCLFAARFSARAPEVLRRDTFGEMTKSHTTTDEQGVWYGYGVYGIDSSRGPVWTHTGVGKGSTAYFACVPRERFAVVVVTNASRYHGWRDVRRAAEEAFLGTPLF